MKRMILLPMLLLGAGGCVLLPGDKEPIKAPPAELADPGPPPTVKPDDVSATNASKLFKQLEDEIQYDEQQPK